MTTTPTTTTAPNSATTPTTTKATRLRDTWLVQRGEALALGAFYVGFTAIWFTVGWLLTHPLKNSWIVHTDQSVSEWFEQEARRLDGELTAAR